MTVIGAGPAGIETAAELAEAGRAVTLVCGGVLGPYLHPQGRRSVAKQLARLGVTVLDGPDATVTAVTRDAVQLRDGRELPSTVTIWTAGFGVPDLAARSGLRTDAVGRLLTDETLASVDDGRIVAARGFGGTDWPFMALVGVEQAFTLTKLILSVGLPLYAVTALGTPPAVLGILYTINTLLVAAGQMGVRRLQRHARRTHAMALSGVVFIASCALYARRPPPVRPATHRRRGGRYPRLHPRRTHARHPLLPGRERRTPRPARPLPGGPPDDLVRGPGSGARRVLAPARRGTTAAVGPARHPARAGLGRATAPVGQPAHGSGP
ncbi:FAD-dependent oxidoreductase [Nonomuraea sp. B19D2]|uniref:FAD-dependent oxidoreductase n=1 Tax=Nonomuraea sp. B19D2 TaxID=3159561 RepID=UPI0032DAC59E